MRCFRHLVCLGVCLSACVLQAADWAQFRGPNASGVSAVGSAPDNWAPSSNILWKQDVPGAGWSSPIVVNDRVYLTTAVPEGGRDSNHDFKIYCFDARTGETLWQHTALSAVPRQGTHRSNTFATETPASDGQVVVAYFGMMGVFCYDLDGNQIWKKDLGSFPMRNNWGTASSPVIHNGKVFFQMDNEGDSFVVALNLKDGSEVWKTERPEGSNWGTPVVWNNRVRTELVTLGEKVRSYNPESGEQLWEIDLGSGGANSTPSGNEQMIVFGTGGRGGSSCFAIAAGASGVIAENSPSLLWSTREAGPHRASPLLYDGMVYLLSGRGGQIQILDAKNGEQVHRGRLQGAGEFWASPWAANGLVFCPDADGHTFVLEPGSDANVVRTNNLPDDDSTRYWASTAISDNVLFVRSSKSLYAIRAE